MPISQQRMLDLLAAAQDYRQACQKVVSGVEFWVGQAQSGVVSPEEALAALAITYRDPIQHVQASSIVAVITEELHWRGARAERNERHRAKRTGHGAVGPAIRPRSALEVAREADREDMDMGGQEPI
jgi:hypothetical protein